ncbi:MAG: hypothetical protein OEZ28_08275 [Nitrospinota bacterium]|nr:hypothetical protein [Nitrospinota bacterium]
MEKQKPDAPRERPGAERSEIVGMNIEPKMIYPPNPEPNSARQAGQEGRR